MRQAITPEEIDLLGKFVKERSGICLDQSKGYLFETRLAHLLDETGAGGYRALHAMILQDRAGSLGSRVVEAMCTNETSFFRDRAPFNLLAGRLAPDFFRHSAGAPLKILSAACSTGQEVYSAAMTLADAGFLPPARPTRMTATDISDAAIAVASRGVYSKFELARGIDAPRLHKYFTREGENAWKVADELRGMVVFKKLNLLDAAALSALGKFDVIFCRNVAIYFSAEDKKKLFALLGAALNPKGALIIGSTESLLGVHDSLVRKEDLGCVYYAR